MVNTISLYFVKILSNNFSTDNAISQSIVLVGLAGAAIPVILNLLNYHKLRTVEFSTLTF